MKWSTTSVVALGLAFCLTCAATAQQPGGRSRGGFGGFGGGFGGGGGLMLLGDESVRKEIGLSDDKYQQLQEEQRNSFQGMGDLFRGLQDLSDDQRQARIEEGRKKMADAQKKIEEKYLTAAQRERLKQLSVQSRLNRGGAGEAIASDEIASELGLSDADKEKIRQAAEDAQEEMRAKIQKLQDEAREKVIASLKPEQKAKLDSMMGKKFEFSNNMGGFAGFGGGGAGGRGGFGGGFGGGRGGPGGRGPGGDGGGRPARPPVERLPDGD